MHKVILVFLLIFVIVGCREQTIDIDLKDFPEPLEQVAKDDANLVLMISNQSFDKPEVTIIGELDDEYIFIKRFLVKDQHQVDYYYYSIEEGQHNLELRVLGELISIVDFELSTDLKYNYITHWYSPENDESVLRIMQSEEMILLD